jgi:UrcA family protein
MTTDTQLPRRSSAQTAIRAASLITLSVLAPTVALSDQPPATRIAKVSLSGLDLSTAAGSRAAYERIKAVAERLCFLVESDPFREIYTRCVRETLTAAIQRINAPALAAVEK